MKTILITGGTGLIGKLLTKKFTDSGYNVTLLVRSLNPLISQKQYLWNPYKNEIDSNAISSADYIIHLAGAGLAEKRWTKKRKIEIIESRIKPGEMLLKTIIETGKKPEAFISASAIGIYGSVTSDYIFRESDPASTDFTGTVCSKWENAALKIESLGIRTVIFRMGIVLSSTGGILPKIFPLVKAGIGSPVGKGTQFVAWIHFEDLCNIYLKAIIDPSMSGIYNAASPANTTNRELMQTLAEVLRKPFIFPNVPKFLLKLIYGEMSVVLLEGSRISVEKLSDTGFSFKFNSIESALKNLSEAF